MSEDRNLISNGVLHYVPSRNKLYSRHGFVEGSTDRNTFDYKTREFDGGAFGSLKLVKNVTVNGSGSGKVQVYLDGSPAIFDPVDTNFIYTAQGFNYQGLAGWHSYFVDTDTFFELGHTEAKIYYQGSVIVTIQGSNYNFSGFSGQLLQNNEVIYTHTNGDQYIIAATYTDSRTPSVPGGGGNSLYYYGYKRILFGKEISLATGYGNDQPARVYLPASQSNNPYGLSVADVWSVEITNWNGKIDWIDTEYEVLTD